MGKRSNSSFMRKLLQQEAQQNQQQAIDVADAQSEAATLALPTEQLQEAVPQAPVATPSPDFSNFQGPRPENLQRAEVTPLTQLPSTPERLPEVQSRLIPKVEGTAIDPNAQGFLSPQEIEIQYRQQAEDEATIRAGAFDNDLAAELGREVDESMLYDFAEGDAQAEDNGRISLSNALEAGANSVRIDAGQMNLFGSKIETDTVPKFEDSISDPHGFLRRYAGDFSYAIKGFDKLNMLEEPANPNSEIRKEFGRAAILAVILEASDRLKAQAKESDEDASQRRFDDALDRINIGKAIGQRIERLLYPTQNFDPTKEFTGESTGFGYNYRLTPKEQSILGQGIIQGFAHSPAFDWLLPYQVKDTNGKLKQSFRTTREGEQKIAQIRRAARINLGLKDHDRPVSLVPTDKGRLRFEGATTQKEITAAIKKNKLSNSAKDAIEKLATVAHTVSPHKVLLAMGMFKSVSNNNNNIFGKYAKQNEAYRRKKYLEILRKYTARANKERSFTPETLGFETFEEAATAESNRIIDEHMRMRMETVKDGIARLGNSFYYGYIAINNSERLMIAQTELNYQTDKVARFLVDGAVPANFVKGSSDTTEEGFFRLLARSLVLDAGKFSPEIQLEKFKQERNNFSKFGKQLLAYTLNNENRLQQAKETELNDLPPLNISEDLEEFLASHGKDEFYFVLDALHELARYDASPEGQTFKTRLKAEIDGNSNGATIQAMQMGVENILKKGGVLYENVEAIEEDLRDDVFSYLLTEEEFVKEPELTSVFRRMQSIPGKVKDFMKVPIMTSIYGKEPQFHSDTARTFYDDNSELFADVFLDPNEETNRTMIIEKLRERIEFGLTNGLGGALEHSRMAKRVGRIFALANEIAEVKGANGFMVQAGGFEFIKEDEVNLKLGPAAQLGKEGVLERGGVRDSMLITTMRREPSALATARAREVSPAEKNNPDMGSKLRNQLAVNGTQNIDASIAQATVSQVIPNQKGALVMQIYDAFLGDANSFPDLVKVSNKQFIEVNESYNMLEAERNALLELKDKVKAMVATAKASGSKFNIGTEGEYKGLGNFIGRAQKIIMRDMPDGKPKARALARQRGDRSTAVGIANFASTPTEGSQTWGANKTEVLITPDKFQQLFNAALTMLNVENDLDTMIREVNNKRTEIFKRIKAQSEEVGAYS